MAKKKYTLKANIIHESKVRLPGDTIILDEEHGDTLVKKGQAEPFEKPAKPPEPPKPEKPPKGSAAKPDDGTDADNAGKTN